MPHTSVVRYSAHAAITSIAFALGLGVGAATPNATTHESAARLASAAGLVVLAGLGLYLARAICRAMSRTGRSDEDDHEGSRPCFCHAPRVFCLLPTTKVARDLYLRQTRDQLSRGDTGVDLRWPEDIELAPGEKRLIGLGVRVAYVCAVCDTPSAFWLAPRSSLGAKTELQLANGLGLIDRGYRGEIFAAVRNLGAAPYIGKKGEALLQLAAPDLRPAVYTVCEDGGAYDERYFADGATARGAGAFGSTGAAGR